MPLMLDTMRAEFARKLAEDPSVRFSMDKALQHVIRHAYECGLDDGRRDASRDVIERAVREINRLGRHSHDGETCHICELVRSFGYEPEMMRLP